MRKPFLHSLLISAFSISAFSFSRSAPPSVTPSTATVSVDASGAVVFPGARQLVQTFTAATRAATAPLAAGQLGWETDTGLMYRATSTSAGAWTAAGGGVEDGDKGDLTVSSSGTVWTIDAGVIVNADISGSAAIALSKLAVDPLARANHTGTQALATISDAGTLAGLNAVGSSQITDGTITNDDISASAAIALSKLATDPLARANHTGTQTLATISDVGALATYAGIAPSANVQTLLGAANYAAFKSSLSLGNVENTALSTWAGSSNITTLGTLTDLAVTLATNAASTGIHLGTITDTTSRPLTITGGMTHASFSGTLLAIAAAVDGPPAYDVKILSIKSGTTGTTERWFFSGDGNLWSSGAGGIFGLRSVNPAEHATVGDSVTLSDDGWATPGVSVRSNGWMGFGAGTVNYVNDTFFTRQSAAVFQAGADHATTPTDQTLKAHDVTTGTGAALRLQGGDGSVADGLLRLQDDATDLIGFFGGSGASRQTNVADPSGGAIIDAEARAAITEILNRLEALNLFAPP